MLGGMQFGVLVEVLLCELDGRVPAGMQLGVLVVEVLFCESDGRVLGGMQFGVLVEVLFCEIDGRVACSLGCWRRCCFARVMAGC